MAVKAIKYGMKGDEVSNLQTTLNKNGYSLDVDGSFGPQTLAAVKDYQQKNSLTVDGMVGPQTSAVLFGGSSSIAPTVSKPATEDKPTPADTEDYTSPPGAMPNSGTKNAAGVSYPDMPTYDEYEATPYAPSETVQQAGAALDAILAAQPGAYQSKWQGQIEEIIGRILNREEFSYDVNEDALYKQYAEQYQRLGKLAMEDTTGQVAAMTGGYGNSYAATAGNQAYQAYLSQLNEVVPELYGMALDKHNREGQEMYNQYGLLSDQEAQEYGRYMDEYNKWADERDHASGRYDSERDYDYEKYVDERNFGYGVHNDAENREFNEYLTAVGNMQWDANFEEGVRQHNEGMAFNKEQAEIDNDYREKTYARDEAMAILEAGGTVSDDQLAAAGMSKEAAAALSNAYQKAAKSGGSGSGSDGDSASYVTDSDKIGKWSEAILDAETEEEALRYVERLEQLDPDLADSLYEEWLKAHGLGHNITDTTVATPSTTGKGGGGGGMLPNFKQ